MICGPTDWYALLDWLVAAPSEHWGPALDLLPPTAEKLCCEEIRDYLEANKYRPQVIAFGNFEVEQLEKAAADLEPVYRHLVEVMEIRQTNQRSP